MSDRSMSSAYMEWAKLHSTARFNLATSGIANVLLKEFPLRIDDLEITVTKSAYGYEPLRERIARHTGAPEECIVTAMGTSMANHLAMAALLAPGDEVLIEQPAYGPILDVASFLGARIVRFSRQLEHKFAVDPDAVAHALSPRTRLIVLTNFHNPTGNLITTEALRAIGERARRIGARVLVDEVYLEMPGDGEMPFAFPLAPPEENPFIVTSSLTKGYGLSGLRCGWILAAPDIAQRIWRLNDLFGSVSPHTAERMSVMAFDHLRQFRARAATLLRPNRALLDSFLATRADLEYFSPPFGTIVFPRLRSGDGAKFVRLLREKYETSVVPGHFFEQPSHFRIGIGGETAGLRQGLERLGQALDAFAKLSA